MLIIAVELLKMLGLVLPLLQLLHRALKYKHWEIFQDSLLVELMNL